MHADLSKEELKVLFKDFLETIAYRNLQAASHRKATDVVYKDNDAFWEDWRHGEHSQGLHVRLNQFHLTEWLPFTPGRAFTPTAVKSRQMAARFISETGSEYLPPGKAMMVWAGVGSLRLRAKRIDDRLTYFLGASKSGISHEGIPLTLTESHYRSVIRTLKKYGGCVADITGTLQIMPYVPLIDYDAELPRYCLDVDEFKAISPSLSEELRISLAVAYSKAAATEKQWTFVNFTPAGGEAGLNGAVAWLKDYVRRYTGVRTASILSDFDEHRNHFNTQIEFSLSQLFSGELDGGRLNLYVNELHIDRSKIQNILQDNRTIKVGSGATITAPVVVADQIRNSFNLVEDSLDDREVKKLISELLKQVTAASHAMPSEKAQQMAADAEALIKEISSSAPRKKWCELRIQGLRDAARAVGEIGKPILKTTSKLRQLKFPKD